MKYLYPLAVLCICVASSCGQQSPYSSSPPRNANPEAWLGHWVLHEYLVALTQEREISLEANDAFHYTTFNITAEHIVARSNKHKDQLEYEWVNDSTIICENRLIIILDETTPNLRVSSFMGPGLPPLHFYPTDNYPFFSLTAIELSEKRICLAGQYIDMATADTLGITPETWNGSPYSLTLKQDHGEFYQTGAEADECTYANSLHIDIGQDEPVEYIWEWQGDTLLQLFLADTYRVGNCTKRKKGKLKQQLRLLAPEVPKMIHLQQPPGPMPELAGLILDTLALGDLNGDGNPEATAVYRALNDATTLALRIYRQNGQQWKLWIKADQALMPKRSQHEIAGKVFNGIEVFNGNLYLHYLHDQIGVYKHWNIAYRFNMAAGQFTLAGIEGKTGHYTFKPQQFGTGGLLTYRLHVPTGQVQVIRTDGTTRYEVGELKPTVYVYDAFTANEFASRRIPLETFNPINGTIRATGSEVYYQY